MQTRNILKKELRQTIKQQVKAAFESGILLSEDEQTRLQNQVLSLPEFQRAKAVMVYLNLPEEVPTTPWLYHLFYRIDSQKEERTINTATAIKTTARSVIIPWCQEKEIRLFRLSPPEGPTDTTWFPKEVVRGAYGILEPALEYRARKDRQFKPEDLDFILVPGVAFDSKGGRLGRGAGFYDRFFQKISSSCFLAGLAFEEQVVDSVPMESHDHRLNCIITPKRVIRP